MEYLLALDVGTSSMRGGIYDRTGKRHFMRQVLYEVHSSPDGSVEQDPAVFLAALDEIAARSGEFCRERGLSLCCVSLTSQRSSLIAADRDGQPLRPAIMWHDKRSQPVCDGVNARCDTYAICGMKATPVFTAPKILWLRQNEEETYQKAYKLLGVHEFLLYHMTGEFVTDASIASRSCLMDLKTLDWSAPLLEAFQTDREKLCRILPVGSVCGRTGGEFSRLLGGGSIPVVSAGGDQQCAALGLGATRPGLVSVNCGTGAYAVTLADAPVFDPARNVLCNVSAVRGKFMLETLTMASGLVYNWFNREIYHSEDYRAADGEAGASPPGANGVLMLPDLMGRGMPDWDADARGVFYHIGFHTTRGDLARAVMEALAAGLCDCLDLLRAVGAQVGAVSCSGGLSKNPLFNQIQADMYGIPVRVPKNSEATLLGAWTNGALALHWFADHEKALAAVEDPGRREYLPNPETRKIYQSANEARHMLYRSLNTAALGGLLDTAGSSAGLRNG